MHTRTDPLCVNSQLDFTRNHAGYWITPTVFLVISVLISPDNLAKAYRNFGVLRDLWKEERNIINRSLAVGLVSFPLIFFLRLFLTGYSSTYLSKDHDILDPVPRASWYLSDTSTRTILPLAFLARHRLFYAY